MTVLTPSYHAEFRKIDELVRQVDGDKVAAPELNKQENGEIAFRHGSGMGVVAAGSGNPKAGTGDVETMWRLEAGDLLTGVCCHKDAMFPYIARTAFSSGWKMAKLLARSAVINCGNRSRASQ
ncbi:hypothetical protein ACLOJK_023312, partial [Asimina triloba]